jgi:hypothetical protein
VRGSPFLRTLLLAGGLLLAGLVLWRLTREPRETVRPLGPEHEPIAAAPACGFELKLSARAESVELKNREGRVLFQAAQTAGPLLGKFMPDVIDPAIFVTIRWADGGEGNHFAKLTLEPPGKPTRVRYFEAAGDLEDVWELSAK